MSQSTSNACRLWISDQLFLRVDGAGYALGPCFEGALGCVLQLLPEQVAQDEDTDDSLTSQKQKAQFYDRNLVALKIPRMMADTITENAYISAVLNDEERIVFEAGANRPGCGLVPTPQGNRYLLKGVRSVRDGYTDESRRQDGCVLFVSFSKGKFPRLCNVKFNKDELIVFPNGAKDSFAKLTPEVFAKITAAAKQVPSGRNYYKPAYWQIIKDQTVVIESTRIGQLGRSIDDLQEGVVWYIALPSIAYGWADGTLQESISNRRHQSWLLKDHYTVILQILEGLKTLHTKGLLHGDIRPANIMSVGSPDDPRSYLLGDYGSFSMSEHLLALEGRTQGHTTLAGPGVNRHRTSVFYAPERRNSVERETADTAIIIRTEESRSSEPIKSETEYLVYFGWYNQLVDRDRGILRPEIQERLNQAWQQMVRTEAQRRQKESPAGWELRRGDRLRVRDYVFTIKDSAVIDGQVYFRCLSRYARVIHERMAVIHTEKQDESPSLSTKDEKGHDLPQEQIDTEVEAVKEDLSGEGIGTEKIVNIPYYVEIRQWSVATDLYGIGVLALYTIFSSGLTQPQNQTPKEDEVTAIDKSINKNVENMLSHIVNLLDSEQNFEYLWPDLELFRKKLEEAEKSLFGQRLAEHIFEIDEHNKPTLFNFAKDITGNIRRTTKDIDYLINKFDCNVAHFLLFMHFVLSCLHRQTSLPNQSRDTRSNPAEIFPFCTDRCQLPSARTSGNTNPQLSHRYPAELAYNRLKDLQSRFDQGKYSKFVVRNLDGIPKYDPKSDIQIRIEKDKLEKSNNQLQNELNRLKDSAETLRKDRDARIAELRGNLENAEKTGRDLSSLLSKNTAEQQDLNRKFQAAAMQSDKEIANLRKQISDKDQEIGRLQAKLNDTRARIDRLRKMLEAFTPSTFGNADILKQKILESL